MDPTHRKTRTFTTKNPKTLKKVRDVISAEWTRRKLTSRIQVMAEISRKDPKQIRQDRLSSIWEKIDFDIGLVFQLADKTLHQPKRQIHEWSPALAHAGAIKRYWRIRLSRAQSGLSGRGILLR